MTQTYKGMANIHVYVHVHVHVQLILWFRPELFRVLLLAMGTKVVTTPSLVPRLSPQKTGEGESLVTSAGKVLNFHCLALAVPIRLQNELNHVYMGHFVH